MSARIRFFEVGPRDGLQNEARILEPEVRVEMVDRLVGAGVKDIEIGAFVHPKWVPQMGGTEEVARQIKRKEGVRYWGLVPNLKGLERAARCGVEHVALVMSATESHNRQNLNRTLKESIEAVRETAQAAKAEGMVIRAYISTVFGCPFEGEVDFEQVMRIGEELLEMGAEHLSLGDTVGMGGPKEIAAGCKRAVEAFGQDRVALHLHDTQGLGLVNALAAYEVGTRLFDGAVGGMGGCPYAPGAAGNVASEDLINMFTRVGVDCGVAAESLCEVTRWLNEEQKFEVRARYFEYWRAQQKRDA